MSKNQTPKGIQQWALLGGAISLATILLIVPLIFIFVAALSGGWALLSENLQQDYMQHALGLTLLVAVLTVPLNTLFGILFAWLVTHYEFRGRRLLLIFIDIPYAVSPVVAGLCYMVIYGVEGRFGAWLMEHNIYIMFAWPGIVLVTLFVTTPYVARTLIPVMQIQGRDEEYAALTLGASGWQVFRHVSLPKIKWGLLYGVVVTNARAVGEFGAVSVVSGAIINQTLTLPLLVDQLHNDNKAAAAFTAAAVLALMALLTLFVKTVVEWRQSQLLSKAEV